MVRLLPDLGAVVREEIYILAGAAAMPAWRGAGVP